jgi:diphthamide synthase (EF-2-diphthine--ammonia ligase)
MRLQHNTGLLSKKLQVTLVHESGEHESVFVDHSIFYKGHLVGDRTAGSYVTAHKSEGGISATIRVADEL